MSATLQQLRFVPILLNQSVKKEKNICNRTTIENSTAKHFFTAVIGYGNPQQHQTKQIFITGTKSNTLQWNVII